MQSAQPDVEQFITLLMSMRNHSYGEQVDMLSHSLQTASCATADDASDTLVVAALLHDIGHLFGAATKWGLPDHAKLGAQLLLSTFGPEVSEPVRLHVDAKRALVATDPSYLANLSEASVRSLAQQGGPFSQTEAQQFGENPYADAAIRLRKWDDSGKSPEVEIVGLESYRPVLQRVLSQSRSVSAPGPSAEPISAMWARESCRCELCLDSNSGQRLVEPTELRGWSVLSALDSDDHNPDDHNPDDHNPDDDNPDNDLVVFLTHEDGRAHRCLIRREDFRSDPLTRWGAEHSTALHRAAANTEGDLDEIAKTVSEYGIAVVAGLGTQPGEVLRFARRIGFVRETNYGDLFDVIAVPDPSNLAFTPRGLPLHTDNPYRDPVPTVQLLHCLKSAGDAGSSLFCDGFNGAEQLRRQHRDSFEILTSTDVRFRFVDNYVDLVAVVPLISLDSSGAVIRVTMNNRSMVGPISTSDPEAFYEAYTLFAGILANESSVIELVLEPGELIIFDNRRVLHGRRQFPADSERHLQGCYIDIDALNSRARVG